MTRSVCLSPAVGLGALLLVSPLIVMGDVVSDWNTIMITTINGQSPFAQARLGAITQLSVFEAVNAIKGDYRPYLGTITAPPNASQEAAVVAAAHRVLSTYFPANATVLDAARTNSLASIPAGAGKDSGIAAGEAAAAAMIALRANDGSDQQEFYLPPSTDPGQWQTTPSCPGATGVFFNWGRVLPFAIRSGSQFRSDPPPALNSSRYTRDWEEVRRVGSAASTERPQDRSDVARLYAVTTATRLWNQVALQVAVQEDASLSQVVRMLAVLNVALSDASVAVFDTKYHYNLWRPETAIRGAGVDGNSRTNPDASFTPFISTPCFPAYPSAHGTLASAAREVLERSFGSRPHTLTITNPIVAGITLRYTRFRQISDDIDDARVYGGIHFRFDQDAGAEQGQRLGAYVDKHSLRRARDCDCEQDGQ